MAEHRDSGLPRVFLREEAGISLRQESFVFGRAGGPERLHAPAGVSGLHPDANLERLDLARELGTLSFQVTDDGLTIAAEDGANGGTPVATLPSLNQPLTLATPDGDVTLRQTGAQRFTISGEDGAETEVAAAEPTAAGVTPGATETAAPDAGEAPAADVFLPEGGSFTATQPVEVFGRGGAGTEHVRLAEGAEQVQLDANLERITLPVPSDSISARVTEAGLEIAANGTTLVTLPSLNQTSELVFTDGTAELAQTGAGRFELADPQTSTIIDRDGMAGGIDLGGSGSSGESGGAGGLTVADTSATEGEPLRFQVTTTGIADGEPLLWQVFPGGPGEANTFDVVSLDTGSVAVSGGTATIPIPTADDAEAEDAEDMVLRVSHGGHAPVDTGVGTIRDDDDGQGSAERNVIVRPAVADEGDALVFRVETPGMADGATLDWSVDTSSTRATPADLAGAASGSVTVSGGTATIEVATAEDDAIEGDATVRLDVAEAGGGASGSASGIIREDDDASTTGDLDVAPASGAEGGTIRFRVTSAELDPGAALRWSVADLGTTAADFAGQTSGTVTLGSGGTAEIGVTPAEDARVESAETFELAVAHPETGARDTAIGEIAADQPDGVAERTLSDAAGAEGETLTFRVLAPDTAESARSFTWSLAFSDGALAADIGSATQGQVTLPAGARKATFDVRTAQDSLAEGNAEAFDVDLEDSDGNTVAISQGRIVDDDSRYAEGAPHATLGDATTTEGGDLVFPVGLSGPADQGDSLTVVVSRPAPVANNAEGITADDFPEGGLADAIVFDAGQTTGEVRIPTADDTLAEATETLTLAADSATLKTPAGDAATGTIRDNDGNASAIRIDSDGADPMLA